MKKKNPFRYRMDFNGPWLSAAAALIGGAFFLRAAYFFGFRGLSDNLGTLLLVMALPMVLEAAFVIVLRGIHLNAPGLCGILAALYCVVLLVQCLLTGEILRILLGIVGYLACGIALLALILGWIHSRGLVFAVFAVTAAVQFLLFDLADVFALRMVEFMPEAAALCGLLAMACLPFGMKQVNRKASRRAVQGL